MANTTAKKEEVVEEVRTTEKRTPTKSSDLDAKMVNLTDLMAQFMQTMMATQSNQNGKSEGEVRIVHLAQMDPQLGTTIHLSNLVIGMTEFGEERSLTIQQFEELLAKHRSWFTKGLLCVASGYEDIAKKYGVATINDCPIDKTFIKTLGDVSMDKIEEVYTKLPAYGKDNLVSYWLRCAYDGDVRFRDVRRVKTFNDITGGKLENLLVELNRKPSSQPIGNTRPNIVRY